MHDDVRLSDLGHYYVAETGSARDGRDIDQIAAISINRDGAVRCKVMKNVDVDKVGDSLGYAGYLCGVIVETIVGNRGRDDHEQ